VLLNTQLEGFMGEWLNKNIRSLHERKLAKQEGPKEDTPESTYETIRNKLSDLPNGAQNNLAI